MISEGKNFENQFKKSCEKQNICCIRLRDNPSAFAKENSTTFTNKQPCDFLVFQCRDNENKGNLFCLELKSTKQNFITIQVNKDDPDKMIHYHQIECLSKLQKYNGVKSGLIFNFRRDDNDINIYINIDDLINFINKTGKKNINIKNAILYGGIILDGKKLRTKYTYDIKKLLDDISSKKNGGE